MIRKMLASMVWVGLVACAPEEKTEATDKAGPAVVASTDNGDRVESTVTASGKNDDSLKVTFDKKGSVAKIQPKYGQPVSVQLGSNEMPASAKAANKLVKDAMNVALSSVKTSRAGTTITPKGYVPPDGVCVEHCEMACEDLEGACGAKICAFGCGMVCSGVDGIEEEGDHY